MLARFLQHQVLANLTFVLVLAMGSAAYLMLPREKDPEINFNWIQITTAFPGASAEDVEKLITDPLEEAVSTVSDIKFVSSSSREGLSSILVRFNDIPSELFDKRVNDLRREVQNAENDELPADARSPILFELTTANAFPTATLVLQGQADDRLLHDWARRLEQELERQTGIDRIDALGLRDPELHVFFDTVTLATLGLNPTHLADTVRAYFRDTSAGSVTVGDQQWLLRMVGTNEDPGWLARLPVVTAEGEVPLGSLAEVQTGREKPSNLVSFHGQPGVVLSVFKKGSANTLELLDLLRDFVDRQNVLMAPLGLSLNLVDDQTVSTRAALGVMQTNALYGLLLVLLVSWVFLGSRIALFTCIGIPFTIAATFWLLSAIGATLNNSVLLGVVISLGMLVDDAVVVVESIYYRLQRGHEVVGATVESLKEVFAPVTASVLTTVAAFLPLMLLPGILGDFMRVVPLVVTLALLISLIEAYWMLPAHVIAARLNFNNPSPVQRHRERLTHWIRVKYSQLLIKVLRRPRTSMSVVGGLFLLSLAAFAAGMVHINFFAMDSFRLFYVNVEMPVGSTLHDTLDRLKEVEQRAARHLEKDEVRGMVGYTGLMFTETEPLFGDQYGQLMISLHPKQTDGRDVPEIIDAMRAEATSVAGPTNISFLELKDGPPTSKAIKVKVRGDDFNQIRAAVRDIRKILSGIAPVRDVTTDDSEGRMELVLRPDTDAIRRAGLEPSSVSRILRLLADGEIATAFQYQGEKVEVRVQAHSEPLSDIYHVLGMRVALNDGNSIALGDLVTAETQQGAGNIRHYNLRRAITVEADIDQTRIDTLTANRLLQQEWSEIQVNHPGINLDFSGELDDIQESLNSIGVLFLLGLGLIYLILGTQFQSYFQPLMILSTVPLAFTGVVFGLVITQNPLSLYTMYGVVALAGIAVNSAIVLISAANDRVVWGMSILHATIYAARRRVIPILITSLTTIAGLFSLAIGLGGRSAIWGPVATAIVWGLTFSTLLTLFVIPLLYRFFMERKQRKSSLTLGRMGKA